MALILNSSASSFATRKSFLFSSAPSSPFKSKSQKSNHQIKPNPRIFFESKFLGAPKNQRVHRISSTVAPPPLLKKQLRNLSNFGNQTGAVIIVESIILAASGFLPEEWVNFFVEYLCPSFTLSVLIHGWNCGLWSTDIPAK